MPTNPHRSHRHLHLENNLLLQIRQYNPIKLVRYHEIEKTLRSACGSTRCDLKFTFDIRRQPLWANMVTWLREWHCGRVKVRLSHSSLYVDGQILYAMFQQVRMMDGEGWQKVTALLDPLRQALVAVEPQWAAEGENVWAERE